MARRFAVRLIRITPRNPACTRRQPRVAPPYVSIDKRESTSVDRRNCWSPLNIAMEGVRRNDAANWTAAILKQKRPTADEFGLTFSQRTSAGAAIHKPKADSNPITP